MPITARKGFLGGALGCLLAVSVAASATPAFAVGHSLRPSKASTSSPTSTVSDTAWVHTRSVGPARTEVRDAAGLLMATFTDGSRSVVVTGPLRTFREGGTTATVTTPSWARLLPSPFAGVVDPAWLTAALIDRSPDVLSVALQYVTGAPTLRAADGSVLAVDASYGPLVGGVRQEGSDWNDFLQVAASYDGVLDRPEREQTGALDCSGFVRMVFGRRSGYPMVLLPDGVRLPRRATQMHTGGPGTLVSSSRTRLIDLSHLLPGDLVLFDASTDDGAAVDHVGIYLGTDAGGSPRFVSSRKAVDGPTLGDTGGRSTLTGTGLYATSLRAIRRI